MANTNLPESKKTDGAEAYPNKTKSALPWWLPVLLLLPLLALIGYFLRPKDAAPTETAPSTAPASMKAANPAPPPAADATNAAAPAATGTDKMSSGADDKAGDKKS